MAKKTAKLFSILKTSLLSGRVVIFLFCILFSVLFWAISELNRGGNFSITIPVTFTNLPQDKILLGNLPENLVLDIKGSGIRLFQLSLKKFKEPVVIDFSQLKKVRENAFYIGVSNLSNLTTEVIEDVDIIKINPELVFFASGNLFTKEIPVKANVMIESESSGNLALTAISNPASIKISGDSQIVSKIDTVFTEKIIIDHPDNNFKQKSELIFPEGLGELFYCAVNQVEVQISLDKFTDYSLEIPIEIINIPKNKTVKLFPDKVKISFQVGLKSFEAIDKSMFHALVDFNKYSVGKDFLKIELKKFPGEVKNIKLFPERAEFLIK
ncbi:MAG: hypothetical protein ACK452_10840 [Bacteroidota bacterium]